MSESGRAAALQTLARDRSALGEVEMRQLCAIVEDSLDSGVAFVDAFVKNELVQLAAAVGHLDQARIVETEPAAK